MNTDVAFCTACNGPVRLTWTPMPSHDGQAPLHDSELVCLEFRDRCGSTTCPHGRVPAVVMGVRLARSGLRPEGEWRHIVAPCEGCDAPATQEVLSDTHSFCPICGTTNRWMRLEVDDAWVLALAPAVHGIPLPGATDVPD